MIRALPLAALLAFAAPAAAQETPAQTFTGKCIADPEGEKLLRDDHAESVTTLQCDSAEWVPDRRVTLWQRDTPAHRFTWIGEAADQRSFIVRQVSIDGGAPISAKGACTTAMIQNGTQRAILCSATYTVDNKIAGTTAIFIAGLPKD